MDKRYQVFISSTYTDLIDERREVMMTLLGSDAIPAGMELFQASDEDQWSYIKGVIDQCDYYVLIVGWRYGSLTPEGISYTEKEFDYALAQRKPIMAFVRNTETGLDAEKVERTTEGREAIERFRQKVMRGKMCRKYDHPKELAGLVLAAFMQAKQRSPAVGWIRGDMAATPEMLQKVNDLRDRVQELEAEIDRLAASGPKDSEHLAQGGDPVCFHIWDAPRGYVYRRSSWDDLFSSLGTLMMDECDEKTLREKGVSLVEEVSVPLRRSGAPSDYFRRKIDLSDFEQIKIQLFALGLIERSERKRGVRDTNTYWTLTPFGRDRLMKLRAIRKDENPWADKTSEE